MAAATQAKKSYRVVIVGATYLDPVETVQPDGSKGTSMVYKVGRFGDTIDLTEAQATRLLDLGAVKEAGSDLSYEEMTVDDLKKEASERGVEVSGSGANGAVLKEDLVNALSTFDQGQASSAS